MENNYAHKTKPIQLTLSLKPEVITTTSWGKFMKIVLNSQTHFQYSWESSPKPWINKSPLSLLYHKPKPPLLQRKKEKISSVQFSCSVMSDSLWPHELQHARPPCPSPTHGVYLNSCPSSWWCHPAISSSVIPLSSCSQSLPPSGSFPMSQFFAWGGQSIGVSASASVLPMRPSRLG